MQNATNIDLEAVVHAYPNPWFLWHGIFFIATFAILMPVATYLVFVNKERYYETHNILGVIILVLLVLGWACLAQGVSVEEAGGTFLTENMSPVGVSHSVTGIIAKYVALGACVTGVLLRVLRMPKKIRLLVRIVHGVVGVGIAIMGVFVVWNGWVRIGITYNSVLDTSPVIWSLALVGFSAGYMWHIYDTKLRPKQESPAATETDVENNPATAACMSFGEMVEIVKEARFFIFNKTEIIVLDDDFVHPGGMSVLEPFLGRDITLVFSGQETFLDSESNATRMWSHSAQALERLRTMRVGVLEADGGSTEVGRGERLSMELFDESDKSVGIVIGKDPANLTGDCVKFTIKVVDALLFSVIEIGTKLKLSMSYETSAVERTYTVADMNPTERAVVFYIKIYPQGGLTPSLNGLEINDIIFISGRAVPVPLPPAIDNLLLICAGTGIVPMVPYINAVLDDSTIETPSRTCTILWWIRDRKELFFMERIADLMGHNNAGRVKSFHLYFTADTADAIGDMHNRVKLAAGRISSEILHPFLDKTQPTTIILSGPAGFTSSATAFANTLMAEGSVLINLD